MNLRIWSLSCYILFSRENNFCICMWVLGQIACGRCVLEVEFYSSSSHASVAAFFEECVIRRELSDNFCHYQPNYDSLTSAPNWARISMDLHRYRICVGHCLVEVCLWYWRLLIIWYNYVVCAAFNVHFLHSGKIIATTCTHCNSLIGPRHTTICGTLLRWPIKLTLGLFYLYYSISEIKVWKNS